MITYIHAAMAKKSEREEGEKGFTLIELLVVILIIGVLAAIAIPVFLNQQNTAKDAAAKSDLTNAKVAYISHATANGGTYSTDVADLADDGYVASTGVTLLTIDSTTPPSAKFCIDATSETGAIFKITYKTGIATGACVAGDIA